VPGEAIRHVDGQARASATQSCGRRAQARRRVRIEVRRVFEDNFAFYGAEKVWRELLREDIVVARCTVERLMREEGPRGPLRGRVDHDHRRRRPARGPHRNCQQRT
jgi:transposase InsO family protein